MNGPSIYTIGYETRHPTEVLQLLLDHQVTSLLDVRLRPQSRRPGLSKTALTNECTNLGLVYAHDRRLGTPADMLQEVRRTGIYDWDGYAEYLNNQQEALHVAQAIVEDHRTALLCYEINPEECHRTMVADFLRDRTGLNVVHL
ncbi:DUF488 family protein [Candidatus Poriferisocius sp.]|uniref:DUF488 domain-containing protein n=1 Tax=Candidatus Poriferisocius sp. TaxID=3101276 RepID=UPI003B018E82